VEHPAIERFVAVCAEDARVAAAFLTGSYEAGGADEHSDVDLGVITTDPAYDDFLRDREHLVRRLGEPLFLESFAGPGPLFFILADGTEGELAVGRESAFRDVAGGPHRVLLDKTGILDGVTFGGGPPDEEEQREALRRLVVLFWHDFSHFMTAFTRGQWWWAYGQLETVRRSCVGLIRLRRDFADAADASEPYFKVEKALTAAELEPLRGTLCTTEPAELLRAARAILSLYRELAPPLARAHGVAYPAALARLMEARLEGLEGRHRP
jgi:lincosamide nucleotidyltransferase